MKYIDSEKLIAEIESRKKIEGWCEVGKDTADVYYARGFRFACDFVLNEITSLQQEQPETTSIKGYLNRDIGGQLIISLSPNYMDDEWMLLESKLFPNIKSGDVPRCVNITIKEI